MTATPDRTTLTKVYYLLALILFMVNQSLAPGGLFVLQLSLWLRNRLPLAGLVHCPPPPFQAKGALSFWQ